MSNQLNLPWHIVKADDLTIVNRDGRLIAIWRDSEDTAWRLVDTINLFLDASPQDVDTCIASFRSTVKYGTALLSSIDWARLKGLAARKQERE
ncbi:MAG: hypothetical protein V2A76_06345 [Planctomycetota bacterium]